MSAMEAYPTKLAGSDCIALPEHASLSAITAAVAASCCCTPLDQGSLPSCLFATAEHSLPVTSVSRTKQSNVCTQMADHMSNEADLKSVSQTAGPDARVDSGEDESKESDASDDDDTNSTDSSLDDKNLIDTYTQLGEAARFVCLVCILPTYMTATGFLVGDRYLMTALHTMKDCLVATCPCSSRSGACCGDRYCADRCWELKSSVTVMANFSFHDSNDWSSEHLVVVLRRPAAVVESLDTIVLELDLTSASSVPSFPKPGFQKDSFDFSMSPVTACNIYLVGHNRAGPKKMDPCGRVVTADYAQQQLDRHYAADKLDTMLLWKMKDLYKEDSQLVVGGNYVLIDCFFMNGASGCPMFRYDKLTGRLKLVAMFLCGLPTGHYMVRPKDEDAAAAYDKAMHRFYRTFEAGVTMAAVRAELTKHYPVLMAKLGW